jgi:hypothetical protein
MIGKPKDGVVVASEKADFIADRIAAGRPVTELELRKLARYLREVALEMERPRATGRAGAVTVPGQAPAGPALRGRTAASVVRQ